MGRIGQGDANAGGLSNINECTILYSFLTNSQSLTAGDDVTFRDIFKASYILLNKPE